MRHEFGRAVRHAISAALLGPVLAPGPAVLAGIGDFPAVEQVVVADFDGDQVADVAVGIPDLKAGSSPTPGP